MDGDDILRVFRWLPAEEQAFVRERLLAMQPGVTPARCSSEMQQELLEMMSRMARSQDPTAMYAEMLRMCGERLASSSACET